MPRVPTYDSFQATPNTLPQTYAKLPDYPVDPGAQAKEMGAAFTHLGDATGRMAADMADQANQIRFDDATNQAREVARKLQFDKDVGYVNLKGRDALDRPGGQSLTDEYGQKLQEGLSQISGTLGNDAQKAAFAHWAGGFETGFRTDLDRHFIQESTTYGLSVAEGIQKGAMDDIALNWNNPAAVNAAVSRIQAETYRQAKLQGKSAEWQDAQSKALTSTAHKLALSTALENNDSAYAEEYLKRYSSQMNADDILSVKGHITKDMNNKVGMSAAFDVIQKAQPSIQIGDGERAFNIAINAESGGKQYAGKFYGLRPDGTAKGSGYLGELKRPDGGVMTEYSIGVNINGKDMDIPTIVPTLTDKEKNILLNIKDGEKIPESIVQKAVDHAKSRMTQGKSVWADTPEPLTSSKGAVGIAQVMPSTGPEAAKLAGLPWDENRFKYDANYNKALGLAYFQKQLQVNGGDLAKAYAAYNAGPGALQDATKKSEREGGNWLDYLPKETQAYVTGNMKAYAAGEGKPPRATFEDLDAQLRNDPRIANSPERYKIARDYAKVLYEEQTQAIKQRDDESVAKAMQAVMQNGGRYSDLPSDVRAAIPAKEVDNVMAFAQKIAKGDDTSSMWLYSKLATDPMKDPLTGQPMSDDAFFKYRRELSEADYKHFSDERAKRAGNQPGSNGPGELNTEAIKQNLDSNLWLLKIDPTPKSEEANSRVGAIRKFVNDYFVSAQREAGKKFTDAEVAQHMNMLFAKNETFRGFWSDAKNPMLKMTLGDIPSIAKSSIKSAFKRQGVDDPTDAQILNAYWQSKVAQQ